MACEVTSSGSKEAESFGRTPPDLGAQIRGGRESHNQDRLPMAVSGGTTSLAWLEEEVPPRWSRASLMSPKATSENMSSHYPAKISPTGLALLGKISAMITLSPGDVPCYMLLEQVQVPRVIGKAGAIIKELRQESGATVNILDKQLPEALQGSYHVAFAQSQEPENLRSAVLGLVRNARGPMALKSLGAEGQEVAFLVPAKCQSYIDGQLLLETKCSVDMETIQGMRKHRKVTLRAEETHDLQVVAWRLQELQLRMRQEALLEDRDFDLQERKRDTAWDDVMEAFRSKRDPAATQATTDGPSPAVPLERRPILSTSSQIEVEARKARELEQKDLEAVKEKERKKQLRESAAREQQECQTAAREAKMFADKAREMRLRAAEAPSVEQQNACLQEAERYEEQARQARGRSTRGYGIGPRAQQHEYQEASETPEPLAAVPESSEEQRRRTEREEQIQQRKLRDQQAREKEAREREALHQAHLGVTTEPQRPRVEETKVTSVLQPSVEKPAPSAEKPAPWPSAEKPAPWPSAEKSAPLPSAEKSVPLPSAEKSAPLPSAEKPAGAAGEIALLMRTPDWKAAEYLASSRLGIGRRTGTKLSVESSYGYPLLQIHGTPVANAVASYLAQEALRARDDNAVRRELEMLEEKMMRQVLRLQEQSERFMDIMMHPLEAKVAALEGRQPVIDCSIAELRGNLKGIQDSMEMQVRRSDQTETRMCKWRKTLEEELQSRMGEVNHRLGEGPAPSDTVSRSEMVELAKVLKKELKKLVEESFQDGQVVSRQELASLGKALREEMAAMEKLTAETAAAKLQGHQELMNAAEAVRAEMKTLTEKAIQEEALVRASMSAVALSCTDLGPRLELKTHTALGSAEIGPFFMMWNFRIAALLLVIADASEIAILPNAKLVMDGSELPADVQSRHDILKVEAKQSQQDHSELPETIEDVEARWLGMALSQIGWFLSESPLSLGKKATGWMLSADEVERQTKHQSMALSLLESLGVSVRVEQKDAPIPRHPHTMFGGIPWLLIIPVALGIGLALLIQAVSLYSEWSDNKEKLARGEPIEDSGYGY
eukprot:symbB.v1.2.018778.t2/scaffold1511.1/size114522/5